eukprot:3387773-Pyramimonas_sp.AAC.1
MARIRPYVDDVCTRDEGPGQLVLEQTKHVASALVQGMLDTGLQVSPKPMLMMTEPEHEDLVLQHVASTTCIRVKETKWATDLGVDCSMGVRRACAMTKG